MRDHVLPVLGEVAVDAIDVHAVRRVLDPLWAAKSEGGAPDTASRTRAHIEAVIDFASFEGWRGNPAPANPARWKGSLEHAYPPIAELKEDKNHDAVDPYQAAAFIAAVRELEGHDARALEFLAMTAVRTGSCLQATWGQIDRAGRVWSIPTTKTDQPQWVPLTDQMLRCLDRVAPGGNAPADICIFQIDRNAIYQCCQRVARKLKVKATPHGWRATFKTAAGLTGQDTTLTEAALSHAIGTEVCRRYDRATVHRNLLKHRRSLMAWWCGALDGNALTDPEDGESNVVPLTRVA